MVQGKQKPIAGLPSLFPGQTGCPSKSCPCLLFQIFFHLSHEKPGLRPVSMPELYIIGFKNHPEFSKRYSKSGNRFFLDIQLQNPALIVEQFFDYPRPQYLNVG